MEEGEDTHTWMQSPNNSKEMQERLLKWAMQDTEGKNNVQD